MKKFFALLLSGIFIFSGFFFVFRKPAKANWANHVVISEVQITGGVGKANNDFIELYNPTNQPINISGWKLRKRKQNGDESSIKIFSQGKFIPAHSYFLWANSENNFHLTIGADEWSTSYLTENNSIALFDNEGNLIDALAWGSGHNNPFIEGLPHPVNPSANQSLERKPANEQGNGEDTNDNSQDFILQEDSNPNNSQTPPRPPISKPPEGSSPSICGNNICEAGENFQNCSDDCPIQYNPSDLVINEFVSDPIDGEEEWVELYNNTDKEIDLTNWKIEDGSGSQTTLSGIIGPKDFFLVEKIKGYLNNTGDIIKLVDPNGRIIDQVVYGNWDDGNKEDNAPTTTDPNSVARIIDGYDTDQDNLDFKVSSLPTKGKPNKFSKEKEYPFGVIINELLPNPKGDDSENEFIELKNITDQDIDLEGWKIEDASGLNFIISSKKFFSTKIPARGFFVLWRKDSKIPLNNSGGERVKLLQPNGNLVDFVDYRETMAENIAYARDERNNWVFTTQATPGEENIIKKVNQKPKAVISCPTKALTDEEITFDASDSYDPDGDNLTYRWDFGDGSHSSEIIVKHTYKKAGKYNVKLEVKDSFGAGEIAKLTIEVLAREKILSYSPLEVEILITEFLPNPKGNDNSEWIEIYNAGQEEIDLSGWFLDDSENGSKPYQIKEGTKILPGEYLVFKREETKIVLNNNFDSVRILDPEGNLFFEVFYEKPKEGFSYAIDENNEWHWTSIFTPGKKNIFTQDADDEKKLKIKITTKKENIIEVSLKEIRNQDIGDLVKTQGVVSVEPGILGSQIFYLSGSGIQIYSYKKDFPDLKIGDKVEVIGELAEYKGETRIKIFSRDEIKILKNGIPLQPLEVRTGEIDEDLEGNLVLVKGQLIESRTNYFYLDDGSGEIKVYLKNTTGIKKPKMKEGDWLKVVGIVSQYGEEYRLLPRYQTDLEVIKEITNLDKFQIATFSSETKPFFQKINPFSKIEQSEKIKYLSLTALTLLIILAGLIIKRIRKQN